MLIESHISHMVMKAHYPEDVVAVGSCVVRRINALLKPGFNGKPSSLKVTYRAVDNMFDDYAIVYFPATIQSVNPGQQPPEEIDFWKGEGVVCDPYSGNTIFFTFDPGHPTKIIV